MSLLQSAKIVYMRSKAKHEPAFPIFYLDLDWDKYKATSAVTKEIADNVEPAANNMMKGMAGTIYNMPTFCVGYFLEDLIDRYGFDEVAVKMNNNGECEYEFRWM